MSDYKVFLNLGFFLLFILIGIDTLTLNIKGKRLIKLLPKEKVDSFRFGMGWHNFDLQKFVMTDYKNDIESVTILKKELRPVIIRTRICFILLFLTFFISNFIF